MPKVRRKMKVAEISLVKSPANPGAQIALFKSAHEDDMDEFMELAKAGDKAGLWLAMQKAANTVAPPNMTPEEIISAWLGTPEGKAVWALYRGLRDNTFQRTPPTQKHDPLPAFAAIKKAADEVRAESPELTPEQAMAKVLEQKPGLYASYENERRTRQRRAKGYNV